jgi:hypothetical protein
MKIWMLWAVLHGGLQLEAGQYQTEEQCRYAAQMQRTFWLASRPRIKRLRCELVFTYD